MLALRTAALARSARPTTRQVRAFHVENVVNNNTPFKYEGASRRTFSIGLAGLMGFGFSVPFIASYYQISKASA
ncbi:hypothetical protein JCM8547_008229 [Rhodosporidiobolus lusitaniae]